MSLGKKKCFWKVNWVSFWELTAAGLYSVVSYYDLQSTSMPQTMFFPNTRIKLLSKRALVPLSLDVLKKMGMVTTMVLT